METEDQRQGITIQKKQINLRKSCIQFSEACPHDVHVQLLRIL